MTRTSSAVGCQTEREFEDLKTSNKSISKIFVGNFDSKFLDFQNEKLFEPHSKYPFLYLLRDCLAGSCCSKNQISEVILIELQNILNTVYEQWRQQVSNSHFEKTFAEWFLNLLIKN